MSDQQTPAREHDTWAAWEGTCECPGCKHIADDAPARQIAMSSESTNATPLSDAEIEGLQARCGDVGPWAMRESAWEGSWAVEGPRGFDQRREPFHLLIDDDAEAALIAAAPRLLATIDALKAQLADCTFARNDAERLHLRSTQLSAVLALCDYWRKLEEPTDVIAPMLADKIAAMIRRAAGIKEGE